MCIPTFVDFFVFNLSFFLFLCFFRFLFPSFLFSLLAGSLLPDNKIEGQTNKQQTLGLPRAEGGMQHYMHMHS